MFRMLMSVACRALSFMLGVACTCGISVRSAGRVQSKVMTFNLAISDKLASGNLVPIFGSEKVDVDAFFSMIKQ